MNPLSRLISILIFNAKQMKRTEYIETIEGQANERFKRSMKVIVLSIPQEPKSKTSIATAEKVFFRAEVKKQLDSFKRKAYSGPIILEIDFYTTKDNPPALHTLTKNYLDLLHKEMKEVDGLKELLFKDDNQIKILIANYHLSISEKQGPEIRISSYSLSSFIEDIELADRILTNRFSDKDSYRHQRFIHELERDTNLESISDYKESLANLEKDSAKTVAKFGQSFYDLHRHFHIRRIQESYLTKNEIGIRDLISIFQHVFSYNKKYSSEESFKAIWNITRGYIFFTSEFINLGNAPVQEGDTKLFKELVQDQLVEFKKKHNILFPLLQPINITITFIPPEHNIPDLDNLARSIIPFVHNIFQPPATPALANDNKYLTQLLKKETTFIQRFPPHSITGYQLLHIPRKEGDPKNGKIDFFISDGLELKSNLWRMVNKVIERWEL